MGETELNPVWELFEYIIYPWMERNNKVELEIENKRTGKVIKFENFEDVKRAWMERKIHPLDLKEFVSEKLIEILEPARRHFLEGPGRKHLEELANLKITR